MKKSIQQNTPYNKLAMIVRASGIGRFSTIWSALSMSTLIMMLFLKPGDIIAQTNTVALPSDGNNTQLAAPQGALRYQRGFYLINAQEMNKSGLVNTDTINCIGFTIGAAQDDTTKGKFKVYLENTTDIVSRADTNWILVPGIVNNSYAVTSLFPARYQWQIRTNCPSGSSGFSPSNDVANDNLDPCQPPTHLITTSITANGATLNWTPAATTTLKFIVEYKTASAINWTTDSTSAASFPLVGLSPNTGYQWRIKARCASGFSSYNNAEFTTNDLDECAEPTALNVVLTTDTLAKLSWTGAAGADYYTVQFRRAATTTWQSTISFTDSITINFGLLPGTIYEWQVSTVCGTDSSGAFVQGTNFVTTGPGACYIPESYSVDSITATSGKFTWSNVPGATSYDLRYRPIDIISWTSAITPMDLVHNDSICIPDTTGAYYVPFEGSMVDTFVYTGAGVYVAWEYERATGALSSRNSSLSTTANTVVKGLQGQDSIKYIMSFISLSDSGAITLDTILHVTNMRPETRFCSPALADSVEVVAVYALGKNAPFYTSSPISAVIKNYTGSTQTYPVTLMVKDQSTNVIRYTSTQNIIVPADTIGLIEFLGWTPTLLETDSILISVPAQANEDVLNNNRNFYVQMVTKSIVSYEDGSGFITQAGTDTAAGLTLSRHLMTGCGVINSVQVYLSQSAIGHPVYGIALDSNNVVLAQSSAFTPDSSEVDQFHSFYFQNTRLLKNEKYYVGLAQTSSTVGYFPVGVQWEGGQIRDSAYFRGKINGDSIWHHPVPGRLMIRAELVPGFITPTITGDLFLCSGTMDTLVASGLLARYADSVVYYSSQYSKNQYSAREALGTPNVFPAYGANPSAWLSAQETGRESLVLHFSNPDSINFVDVFETLNPGAIDSIYVKDDGTGLFNLIWSGVAAPEAQVAKRKRITFPLTAYNVSEIRIAFNMDTIPGYSAVDAVCIGRITSPGLFASIIWTGGSMNDTLIVNTPGGYKLTTIDANGCTAMDSVTVVTPVTITPTITVQGTYPFCPGDSIKLISSQTGGNIWSNGATTDSIYVKTAGAYFVTYNDGSGCGSTMSSSVNITLHTPPTVNITGPVVICPGKFITLDAGAIFNSYFWSNSATTKTIDIYLPGQFILKVTDANGCMAADTVITTYGTVPTPMITGTLLFCPNDSTTLRAGTGYSSYLWSTGATSDTIIVKSSNVFTVTVTNADGCEGNAVISTSLFTSPIAAIDSKDGFCPMDSVQLTASGGINYLWSTGSTSAMINVNTTGNYVVSVIDANGCKDTASKAIIQFTPPTPFIAGTLSFCAGGSVTTLNAGPGYQSYLWSTGETSPAILVSTVSTFTVTVVDFNGCTGSASATTSLEGGVPEIPGPITGSLFGMCNTVTPSTYSVANVPNSTCYIWKVPEGATIISGFMADSNVFFNTIQVVFDNSFTGGYIEVAAHNDCGSSPTFNGRRILISASPGSVPGIISGATSGVCKLQTVVYTLPPIVGATSYLWTVPLGADIISGQGTNSVTINFASSFRTGDICIQYTTVCGMSPAECITVSPQPKLDGTITGPTTLCALATNIIYTIPTTPGASRYDWTVPTGATILSGQGTNQIKVSFGTHSGIVTVTGSNNCGVSANTFINVTLGGCSQSQLSQLGFEESKSGSIKIKVFPNPSSGIIQLNIQSPDFKNNHQLQLIDALGRVVYTDVLPSFDQEQHTLDLRHLSTGLYILNLKNGSEYISTKIILK